MQKKLPTLSRNSATSTFRNWQKLGQKSEIGRNWQKLAEIGEIGRRNCKEKLGEIGEIGEIGVRLELICYPSTSELGS
jgi:hypothetical protein